MQDWTQEQVLWALRKWNREKPRIRPTPGDIVAICKLARGRKLAADIPKQEAGGNVKEPDQASRDRVASMVKEAGFAPKRFGGDA